jgi:hypothetical protein
MLKQLIKKMRTIGTKTSTSDNVNTDVGSGRKTLETAIAGTTEESVLVNVANDDAIVFSDEMESVPSLDSEDSEDSDYESEEESDEEEEGKFLIVSVEHEEWLMAFYIRYGLDVPSALLFYDRTHIIIPPPPPRYFYRRR